MRLTRRTLLHAAPAALATPALGQAPWQPDRPIRAIVPFPAGGATDVWARLCLEPMSEILRVPIVVENRSGAGSMIGSDAVAKAAPDGTTLLFTITTLVQAPIVLGNAPYDAIRDFTPIGMMGATVLIFMCRSSLGPRNLPEFVEFARARARAGQGLSMGSYGSGSTGHVFGLQANQVLNLGLTHVAYRGEAPMISAYLGNEVDCGFNSLTSAPAPRPCPTSPPSSNRAPMWGAAGPASWGCWAPPACPPPSWPGWRTPSARSWPATPSAAASTSSTPMWNGRAASNSARPSSAPAISGRN